jgi:hypothetical protein
MPRPSVVRPPGMQAFWRFHSNAWVGTAELRYCRHLAAIDRIRLPAPVDKPLHRRQQSPIDATMAGSHTEGRRFSNSAELRLRPV